MTIGDPTRIPAPCAADKDSYPLLYVTLSSSTCAILTNEKNSTCVIRPLREMHQYGYLLDASGRLKSYRIVMNQ